jgi:hypothetical protein
MRFARQTAAALAAALALLGSALPALAAPPSIKFTVTAGGALNFTSTDNTSSVPASGGPMSATVTVTTQNLGGGQVWINSPANPIGTGGATLNLALITVTCTDGGSSGWLNPGSATLVPGGSSAACATINANVNNQTTTLTITFTLDARTITADTWTAAGGFKLAGSAF